MCATAGAGVRLLMLVYVLETRLLSYKLLTTCKQRKALRKRGPEWILKWISGRP